MLAPCEAVQRQPARRDPYGLRRAYVRCRDGRVAGSIAELLEPPARPDPVGIAAMLAQRPHPTRTCFAGVHALSVPALPVAADLPDANLTILEALAEALERSAVSGPVALALSGGFDSALLLALWKRHRPGNPAVVTLASGITDYCELEATLQTADALGVPLEVVRVTRQDFLAALPAAVSAAEVPFYNLHLVSKLLLARALRQRGIRTVITGDGADQVLAHAPPSSTANFLPWVGALFEAEGVEMHAPFVDPQVVAAVRRRPADPDKQHLRRGCRDLLPEAVIRASKRPRYTPEWDLTSLWRPELLNPWRRELDISPQEAWAQADGPSRTLLLTLSLLAEALG